MIKTICARFKQGYRTSAYPVEETSLPERFLGRPEIVVGACAQDCLKCRQVCPTGAITVKGNDLLLDLGKCIFCGECQNACSSKAIIFSRDYRLAVRQKENLVLRCNSLFKAKDIEKKVKNIFGRSLKLRQVSAGGCNACELDTNVLNTLSFDLARFGIQFVASPRHADGILITGPVTKNMRLAVEKTYQAIASPKLVIAVGACAVSGGIYTGHEEVLNGADSLLPVDVYIPGCPPHPLTILDGILKAVGRLK